MKIILFFFHLDRVDSRNILLPIIDNEPLIVLIALKQSPDFGTIVNQKYTGQIGNMTIFSQTVFGRFLTTGRYYVVAFLGSGKFT